MRHLILLATLMTLAAPAIAQNLTPTVQQVVSGKYNKQADESRLPTGQRALEWTEGSVPKILKAEWVNVYYGSSKSAWRIQIWSPKLPLKSYINTDNTVQLTTAPIRATYSILGGPFKNSRLLVQKAGMDTNKLELIEIISNQYLNEYNK